MKIIGIAGGSGSGKTKISRLLKEKYPDKFDVINLDKYKKVSENTSSLPKKSGFIDWDHPVTNDWAKLLQDIKTLQSGKPLTIDIWTLGEDPLKKPKYKVVKTRTIYPKYILIVEGYLALWHKELRELYSRSYFLQTDQEIRLQRRDRVVDDDYDKKIHIPMHNQNVEPTKKHANLILNASKLNSNQILQKLVDDLRSSRLV